MKPNLEFEIKYWNSGIRFAFGVDEAGRGCLAGPVCAAVLAWPPFTVLEKIPARIRDSKLISEPEREEIFAEITTADCIYGVGFASAQEIDTWNILRATYLASLRALEAALQKMQTTEASFAFFSDGKQHLISSASIFLTKFPREFSLAKNILVQKKYSQEALVKGDQRSFSIAAASILAKVSRDRLMLTLASQFPQYNFAQHKGYGTEAHVRILNSIGPCSEHRKSFSPVSKALALF